ncbi:MAG: ATP-dependent helicase PcrA, helicase / ATP-dependent helicase PcrA [Candidatus Taylorbacteria bacterium]|nr:ATP-dependent helicase PcrA, helicase / ATP-dependent helicase PcrA [Candidatus Taylorbacteria bacterium]
MSTEQPKIPGNNLNSRQQEAVLATEGPVLILAGAGAGKTKTVTHRILHLIQNGASPSSILAITFTNKAAKEMRERVHHLISTDTSINRPISMAERPFLSTFHALGVHIIKENAARLGIPRHFTIYDRSDSKRAVKEAVEAANLDPKQYEPGAILNAISRQKGDGVTLGEFKNRARSAGQKGYSEQILVDVWEKYEKTMAQEKSLDFDDLLLKTAMLLKNDAAVREHYQNVWKYIHVDEYQDTNKVQYMITSALAYAHRNICVVGDIDQMIYSWRGADIQNILNFEKDYPEAKIVLLEENYRSTQTILAAANNVIKKNKLRREKNLFTKNVIGDKIELISSYTESDEARTIAEKARDLIEGITGKAGAEPVEPREIAILYRANFQSRILEEAFLKKNIPYQVLGTRFFDRKEVKDVISFIKASLNRDSVSDLVRIINVPPRGIGKATVLKVVEAKVAGLEPKIGLALASKVGQFMQLLERIKHTAMTQPPSALVKYIIRETGMEAAYRNGPAEEQEKLENLRELASVAAQYDEIALRSPEELEAGASNEDGTPMNGNEAAIEALLTNTALATDQDEMQKDNNAVKLMTVHASKGLEFDHVFIAGLETDLFPHKRLNEAQVTQSEEEEERRLFYVAITRARKKVFLSHAQLRTIYGSQKVNTPSEFISDIGNEHIEEEVVEVARGVKAIFIDF